MNEFAFAHIPKTGGNYVMSKLGLNPSKNTLAWHYAPKGATNPRQKNTFGLTSFSVVRNPWSKLVSTYFFCIKKHAKDHIICGRKNSNRFDFWIESLKQEYGSKPPPRDEENISDYFWLSPQCDWLFSDCGAMVVNHIGKLEQVDDYLKFLSSQMNFNLSNDFSKKNITKHAHYSIYYTKSSIIDFVYEWYNEDIEKFGYNFSSKLFL